MEEKARLRSQRHALYTLAVDVWACGCIAYELLYGAALFKGPSVDVVESNIMSMPIGSFPAVNVAGRRVSATAMAFIQDVLVRNPKTRPTAERLLEHSWLAADQAAGPAPPPARPLQQPRRGATTPLTAIELESEPVAAAAAAASGGAPPPAPVTPHSGRRKSTSVQWRSPEAEEGVPCGRRSLGAMPNSRLVHGRTENGSDHGSGSGISEPQDTVGPTPPPAPRSSSAAPARGRGMRSEDSGARPLSALALAGPARTVTLVLPAQPTAADVVNGPRGFSSTVCLKQPQQQQLGGAVAAAPSARDARASSYVPTTASVVVLPPIIGRPGAAAPKDGKDGAVPGSSSSATTTETGNTHLVRTAAEGGANNAPHSRGRRSVDAPCAGGPCDGPASPVCREVTPPTPATPISPSCSSPGGARSGGTRLPPLVRGSSGAGGDASAPGPLSSSSSQSLGDRSSSCGACGGESSGSAPLDRERSSGTGGRCSASSVRAYGVPGVAHLGRKHRQQHAGTDDGSAYNVATGNHGAHGRSSCASITSQDSVSSARHGAPGRSSSDQSVQGLPSAPTSPKKGAAAAAVGKRGMVGQIRSLVSSMFSTRSQ